MADRGGAALTSGWPSLDRLRLLGGPLVITLASGEDLIHVFLGPALDPGHQGDHTVTEFAELVLHPRRDCRVQGSDHDPVPFHGPQRLGEALLGDAVERAAQYAEPYGAVAQRGYQQAGPLVGDGAQHGPRSALAQVRVGIQFPQLQSGIHKVPIYQKGAFFRNGTSLTQD